MSDVEVSYDDALMIPTLMVLNIAKKLWEGGKKQFDPRPVRQPHPRDFYCPNVDGNWTSAEAQAIQIDSLENFQASGSNVVIEGMAEQNIEKKDEISNKLENLTKTIYDKIDDPTSKVKTDLNVLNSHISLPCTARTNYLSRAQMVAMTKCILRAKKEGTTFRRRKIFYHNVQTFKDDPRIVNEVAKKFSKVWKCHSSAFNVLASAKGLFAGPLGLIFKSENLEEEYKSEATEAGIAYGQSQFSFTSSQFGQNFKYKQNLIPDVSTIEGFDFFAPISWVLVIEKDTIFTDRLVELNRYLVHGKNNFCRGYGIVITGKGFPDEATHRFVRRLREELPESVPFYILADGDAYGIHMVHIYNSIPEYDKSENARKNFLQWIGIRPSQWRHLIGPAFRESQVYSNQMIRTDASYKNEISIRLEVHSRSQCQALQHTEIDRALHMLERKDVADDLKYELTILLMHGFKIELECASEHSLLALFSSSRQEGSEEALLTSHQENELVPLLQDESLSLLPTKESLQNDDVSIDSLPNDSQPLFPSLHEEEDLASFQEAQALTTFTEQESSQSGSMSIDSLFNDSFN